MFSYGAMVRLRTTVRGVDEVLTTPNTISVTILQPDGTTTSPAIPVEETTGSYYYDVTPTQAGRHIARWATTAPHGVAEELFEVAPEWGETGLVSLRDAKDHLNIPQERTKDDAEIMRFVLSATSVVERHVGAVVRRTWTEQHDGGGEAVVLAHAPVLAIIAVSVDGQELEASGYVLLERSGVLRRRSGYAASRWPLGSLNISVTCVSGRTVVDPAWTSAALIILQHMWETQRGGIRPSASSSSSSRSSSVGDPVNVRTTYAIPYRALEMLGEPLPGIA